MKPTTQKFFAELKTIKNVALSKSKRLQLGLIDDIDDVVRNNNAEIDDLYNQSLLVEGANEIVQETYQEKLALEEQIRELDEKQQQQVQDWNMESQVHEIAMDNIIEIHGQIVLYIEQITSLQQELGVDIPMEKYYQALDDNDKARQDNIILELPF
jgi:hypothetical protein